MGLEGEKNEEIHVPTKPNVLNGSAIAIAITEIGHLKGGVNPKANHRTGWTAIVAPKVLETNSDLTYFCIFGVKKYSPPVAADDNQNPTRIMRNGSINRQARIEYTKILNSFSLYPLILAIAGKQTMTEALKIDGSNLVMMQ